MPLFKSNTQTRRASSTSPSRSASPPNSTTSSGGLFNRNGRSSMDSGSSTSSIRPSGGRSFFGMNKNKNYLDSDPTIISARQKIADAERAEREADAALMQARQTAVEAREHVKILEREALEDAQRAKAKQAEAKVITKSAKGLGRH